jgi:hypothetical protein
LHNIKDKNGEKFLPNALTKFRMTNLKEKRGRILWTLFDAIDDLQTPS